MFSTAIDSSTASTSSIGLDSSIASASSTANDITSIDAVTNTTQEYANKLANATNAIKKLFNKSLLM